MPALPRNIILVGFMASGKSAVGAALSRITGMTLLDTDNEIVTSAGKAIDQIFQESGEAAFRGLERSVIGSVCSHSGNVIAAGGGAFVDPVNQARMLSSGLVFCLSARPETIYRRIADPPSQATRNPVRPLLAGDDSMDRIESLLAQRAGAYAQAHHTIETDQLTPEQVAARILELCSARTALNGE